MLKLNKKGYKMAILKQGEKNYLEEHSKEKVAFYEKYLDLYLTVLINSSYVKAINIYDIFCGVGIYDGDGSKGSPVIAMECIKKQLYIHGKNNNKPISLLINDGDKKRVEIAKNHIEQYCNSKCRFSAFNLDAKEIFPLVIDKIKTSTKNENHFVFIDPHGYKDIYKSDIVNIMEAGKSEILIFLPIHLMYRFLKPTQKDKENPSYKPLRRFMTEFNLDYNAQSPQEYIKHIEKAFLCDEKYYTSSYILQAQSNNFYALFFITKHIRGLEKAIDTKWTLDKLCGKGFEKKQSISLFEEEEKENKKENCLEEFKAKLIKYLYKEKTNNEIYLFTLKNGFLIKHTNAILKQLSEQNNLIFDRQIRKNTFYLNYKEYYKNNIIKYKVKINEQIKN